MRYRNTKTGQIIDVPSTLRGNWERLDGGKKPETDSSAVPVPVQNVEEEVKTTAKPKRTRKSKK
jgi:hypothetical protein